MVKMMAFTASYFLPVVCPSCLPEVPDMSKVYHTVYHYKNLWELVGWTNVENLGKQIGRENRISSNGMLRGNQQDFSP
jgi:hypothetical protein